MKIKTAHHHTIRKIISAVGSLFDDISLFTYDKNGKETRRVKVPIIYAPKERFITRLFSDPDLNKKTQISLPRMSYDMRNMSYDNERKLPATKKLINDKTKNERLYQIEAAPFNFDFELYLYVRNIEDGNQLMETILPYFSPDYCIILNDNEEFYDGRTLPVILTNVRQDIDYEGDSQGRIRTITWTVSFTVRGFLYPPTIQQDVIRQVLVNIYDNKSIDSDSLVFELSDGSGRYIVGENVYQGQTLSTASASGIVKSFDVDKKKLVVSGVDGVFMTNTFLTGESSFAQYEIDRLLTVNESIGGKKYESVVKDTPVVNIDITPEPKDANPDDDWDYNIKITEYE